MANLETLELTISANAQSAKQSIDLLTQSLSALAGVVSNAASNMQRLNLQLRTMKTVSEKLPNVGKISGSNKITNAVSNSKYAEEQKKAIQQMVEVERQAMNVRGKETQDIMEQSTKLDLLTMKQKALKMETISMAKEGKLTAKQIADRSMQYQKLSNDIEKLKDTSATTGTAMKTHIESVKKSAGGLLSTIGRIFKTMMIRQAIRKLLQAAKEGLDNYYQYSKKMSLSFSAAMDKVSNKWTQLKNQLGAALGTALTSLLPIINAVASAITVVLNTFTALFALLGGSSTYSRAKEGMDGYAASASNAAGAAKEWLVAFDELNVMNKNSGGGGGGSATNYANMFEEVELPSWLIEWKPIIEAVLAGVLGATILPAIWDWIKKIFGLFSGSAAENAMDFLLKFVTDNDKFKMPDMGSAATEMVTFGAGAAAAAAALPVVREEVEKLVGALDGVSLIGSLLGLVGELLAKVLSSISVPITLDTKEYDEFKEKHDKWLKEIDRKSVKVLYDDDVAFVTKLNIWISKTDTKEVNVRYDDDAAYITKLNKWLLATDTKKINVRYDDDVAFVTKLNKWLLTKDTKTVYVDILYGLQTVLKMAVIDAWVSSSPTKTVYVSVLYHKNTLLKMAVIDAWATAEPTKNVYVSILYNKNTLLKMAVIDDWAKTTPTKNVYVSVLYNTNTLLKMAVIDSWVKEKPTKNVYVSVLYNTNTALKMAVIDSWVKENPTKKVYVSILYNQNTLLKKNTLDSWAKENPTKTIYVSYSDKSSTYNKDTIDKWVKKTPTKNISIVVLKNAIEEVNAWVKATPTKNIKLKMDGSPKETTLKDIVRDFFGMPMWDFWNKYVVNSGKVTLKPGVDKTSTAQVTKDITGAASGIQASVSLSANSKTGIRNSVVEAASNVTVNATAKVTATLSNSTAFGNSIKSSIKTALANTKINLRSPTGGTSQMAKIEVAASGGLFDSADLFVANENGSAEMIGKFGNQTGVANQDQIVDGIRKGVADANSEQNQLLRQQNELLYGILQKTGNQSIGASAALGRVARQSLDMYGALVGG